MPYPVRLCSFSNGVFTVRSPGSAYGNGVTIDFEDSDQFGPSKINLRTGDLSEISGRHRWFWDWYPGWREAGRPTEGKPLSTPIGLVFTASPTPSQPPPA